MTDAPPTHETVLAAIVEARGGAGAFTVETLAIASAVAHLLVGIGDGDAAGAASVATLTAMLPANADPSPPVDLARLSDRELAALERLIEIGTCVKPRREHKPKSSRYWAAFDLVALLDRIEARGTGAPITDDECVEVRSMITEVLGLVVLPARLWLPEMYFAPPSPVLPPADVPEPTAAAPAPERSNVVPIRPSAPAAVFDPCASALPLAPGLYDPNASW
jgi:hypothetical protein